MKIIFNEQVMLQRLTRLPSIKCEKIVDALISSNLGYISDYLGVEQTNYGYRMSNQGYQTKAKNRDSYATFFDLKVAPYLIDTRLALQEIIGTPISINNTRPVFHVLTNSGVVKDHKGSHNDMGIWTNDTDYDKSRHNYYTMVFYPKLPDEGGEIEFYFDGTTIRVEPKQGDCFLFNSWLAHDILPFKYGTRVTMVTQFKVAKNKKSYEYV